MIGEIFARNPSPAPPWAKDMVIYEVNPRTFTSPRGVGEGDGSGTFTSTAEQFDYLQDLGINTIWLAGYCMATDHFYGVWSVYATWRPDVLDPSLGNDNEFSAMVRSAHGRGIRVLLDVISHGVLDGSPLVTEHPKWFAGRSWGMTDYDYENDEFRNWWVDLWVSYVEQFGIDGFRVDIDLRDAELWDQITRRCAAIGHEVLVMPEHGRYHLGQHDTLAFSPDIAADWSADNHRLTTVQVSCHDAGWLSPPGNYYRVRGSRSAFGYSALLSHRVPLFFAGEEFDAGQHGVPKLRRGLFGAGGAGGWLYGSAIDWAELGRPNQAEMHIDVRNLLKLRQQNSDLINADHHIGQMTAVQMEPALPLVPYLRWNDNGCSLLVIGNEDNDPVTVSVELPLEHIGLRRDAQCSVRDLISGEQVTVRASQTLPWKVTVPGDRQPGGGLAVLRVDRCV
jgi:Alpha amylase, catalytic domain